MLALDPGNVCTISIPQHPPSSKAGNATDQYVRGQFWVLIPGLEGNIAGRMPSRLSLLCAGATSIRLEHFFVDAKKTPNVAIRYMAVVA